MACSKIVKNQLTDFYNYCLDVGSSKQFDQDFTDKVLDSDTPFDMENKYLFFKTPQILVINRKGEQDIITIIKSKILEYTYLDLYMKRLLIELHHSND